MSEANPIFSHQFESATSLAKYFKEIYILTYEFNSKSSVVIPANVKIINLNWRKGKPIFNYFVWTFNLIKILNKYKIDVVFFHMTEVNSIMSLPILRLFRIPSALWYAHKSKSYYLWLFNKFGNAILTSTAGSCPIKSKKVNVIGQGINEKYFYAQHSNYRGKTRFVSIGRVDESKNIESIVGALVYYKKIYPEITLDIFGKSSNENYRANLQHFANKKNVLNGENWIKIHKEVHRMDIPKLLQNYDVLINAFNGSLDKILLEAALAGMPVVTTNPEFNKEFFRSNHLNLKENLNVFFESSDVLLNAQIVDIQNAIIKNHSLDHWSKAVTKILMNLISFQN